MKYENINDEIIANAADGMELGDEVLEGVAEGGFHDTRKDSSRPLGGIRQRLIDKICPKDDPFPWLNPNNVVAEV